MQERRAYWRRILEEVRRSGQSIRAFCRDRHVNEQLFYYWRGVLAREERGAVESAGQARFLLVSPEIGKPAEPDCVLELVIERGWRLRIPPGADPATLRAVMAALAAGR